MYKLKIFLSGLLGGFIGLLGVIIFIAFKVTVKELLEKHSLLFIWDIAMYAVLAIFLFKCVKSIIKKIGK